jgi:hypothetical protein
MREEFNLLNNSCGTLTVPATETKSKGQAADAQGVMVFASPFRQLYRGKKLSSIYQDWQKTRQRDTNGT